MQKKIHPRNKCWKHILKRVATMSGNSGRCLGRLNIGRMRWRTMPI